MSVPVGQLIKERPQTKNAQLSVPSVSATPPQVRPCLSFNHMYSELSTKKISPAQIASIDALQILVMIQSR